jgi:hypothetical protein
MQVLLHIYQTIYARGMLAYTPHLSTHLLATANRPSVTMVFISNSSI